MPTRQRARPGLSMIVGSSSLAAGSVSALLTGALVVLAAADRFGLLSGGGGRGLLDVLVGPILLLVWSLGLEPEPAWNHPPAMSSAIAGSPRVYALPGLAMALGPLGRWLVGRAEGPEARPHLGRSAVRSSRSGILTIHGLSSS